MSTVGIIPKVLVPVIGIGIVGDPLPYPELHMSLKEIEIIMRIQAVVVPQSLIVHVLVCEGETRIRVIVFLLPFFMPVSLTVQPKDKTSRVIRN